MSRRPSFKVPDYPRDRPTVPEALLLKSEIYARHSAGCCLHVVIDDGNLRDCSVRYALAEAEHEDCKALAAILLRMSPTQRRKVYGAPVDLPRETLG